MKTATLTLNGKTYEVQLTDEQATEIEKPVKVTGFERAEEKGRYYFENGYSQEDYALEYNAISDDLRYGAANYYTDEKLFEWCKRNDELNRKMRRWAAEHNDEPVLWSKKIGEQNHEKWTVNYITDVDEFEALNLYTITTPGEIYFSTERIAWAAIKEFGDEIKWLAENRPKWF